jgi:acetylornithine deacetylase
MNIKEERLIKEIEGLSDDLLDFASRLVAQPSTLGNEASVLKVMEEELSKLSLNPVKVPIEPDRLVNHPGFAPVPWTYENKYNVVGTRKPSSQGGRSVLFNGHLDVVGAEPGNLWRSGPFDPLVKDGWLYGRGAGDMKSGVAAMTYSVYAVEKAGFGLKAPVTVEGVIEEECSGMGTLACLSAGYDAQAILIPEPFTPAILIAEPGVLWFKVTVYGKPVHAQTTTTGINAIEKSYVIITALRELEAEMNQEVHPAYEKIDHPLNLNIGIIKGGDWPSTVPAKVELHCRLGYFPGVTFDQIRKKIIMTVDKAAQNDSYLAKNPPSIEFYGLRGDGHLVDRNHPALLTLNNCHKTLTGKDAEGYVCTGTSDLRFFYFYGKGGGSCYGPIAENIHGSNERVNIESVIHVAKTYALFLARWCGLVD